MRSYAFSLLAVAATASAAAINSQQPGNLLEGAADSQEPGNLLERAADSQQSEKFLDDLFNGAADSQPLGDLVKQGVELISKHLNDLSEAAKNIAEPTDTVVVDKALECMIKSAKALTIWMENKASPDGRPVISAEEYQTARPALEELVSTTKQAMDEVLAKKDKMAQDPVLLEAVVGDMSQQVVSIADFAQAIAQLLPSEGAENVLTIMNSAAGHMDGLYEALIGALGEGDGSEEED